MKKIFKKTFKRMKSKMLKGKTKKHKKTLHKRKKIQFGGAKFEDFLNTLDSDIFPNIFTQIKGNSTDSILESLKTTIKPGILENMINEAIVTTNTGRSRNLIHKKFPCSYVRELYKYLINGLIDKWIEKCNNIGASNKAKGLGASYIRWVCRATSREFTDVDSLATRLACNKDRLRNRDAQTYQCDVTKPDIPCPSEEYVIARYITNPKRNPIDPNDENNEKWLTLVDAARRDNEGWSLFAEMGKGVGENWFAAI
jgi:hypothetical protein